MGKRAAARFFDFLHKKKDYRTQTENNARKTEITHANAPTIKYGKIHSENSCEGKEEDIVKNTR